jgi:hypothetical protein
VGDECSVITLINMGEGVMVFNATFNNISVISWWSVVLIEKTRETQASH